MGVSVTSAALNWTQQIAHQSPTTFQALASAVSSPTTFTGRDSGALTCHPPLSLFHSWMLKINRDQSFVSSILKSFSSSCGKTASVGGGGGGGGKFNHIASGTEGGDWLRNSEHGGSIIPDGSSHLLGNSANKMESAVNDETSVINTEEELRLWNSVVEEAEKLQKEFKDAALDNDTTKRFVSPVTAKVDEDEYADYLRTELFYQTSIAHDPHNPLLLANYAQFLYLVTREFVRAEYYFKKATSVEPPDAEAHNMYATFLWLVKKDLWAAEESYLEAISADPSNTYYAANYAHFLWSTGGEETCYPLSSATDDT